MKAKKIKRSCLCLLRKFGFYDEYIKTMMFGVVDGELKQVKDSFVWPDDATNEIARNLQSVGSYG